MIQRDEIFGKDFRLIVQKNVLFGVLLRTQKNGHDPKIRDGVNQNVRQMNGLRQMKNRRLNGFQMKVCCFHENLLRLFVGDLSLHPVDYRDY
jgi:hypothetical protein